MQTKFILVFIFCLFLPIFLLAEVYADYATPNGDDLSISIVNNSYGNAYTLNGINYTKYFEEFKLNITYTRYNAGTYDMNEYFKIYFVNSSGYSVNVKNYSVYDSNVLYRDSSPDYGEEEGCVVCDGEECNDCPQEVDLNLIAPCSPGEYSIRVAFTSGFQEQCDEYCYIYHGWETDFSDSAGGSWIERQPNEIEYSDYQYQAETGIENAIDLVVSNIKPIQVIEDVSLVKDKSTIVRVWTNLTDDKWPKDDWPTCQHEAEYIQNVKVNLTFDNKDYIENKPIKKIYVWPDQSKASRTAHYAGIETFNFYVDPPAETGDIAISASVDPDNTIPEYNETNNGFVKNGVKVKEINKNSFKNKETFTILYVPLKIGDWKNLKKKNIDEVADRNHEFFVGTYPFPNSSVIRKIYPKIVDFKENFTISDKILSFFSWKLGIMSGLTYYAKEVKADRIVGVVPDNEMYTYKFLGKWKWDKIEGFSTLTLPYAVISDEANEMVVAHEFGHTYGLNDEDASNSDGKYGNLATDGWWVERKKPRINYDKKIYDHASNFYCFMRSKVGWGGHIPLTWVDSDCYNELATQIVKNWPDPRTLFVNGFILANDTIILNPWYEFENGTIDNVIEGNYSIQFLDNNNEILNNVSFEPSWDEGGEVSLFSFELEYPNDTTKVIIKHDNTILIELNKSANPPTTDISINEVNEIIEINWSTNDSDGDELYYSLFYICNEWANVIPIALAINLNSSYTNYSLNKSDVAGGQNCTVKLIVTDNFHTIRKYSVNFSVSDKPPRVYISRPNNNSVFSNATELNSIIFEGWAYDPEFGDLDDSFSFKWESDMEGIISNTNSFIYSNLSLGLHKITFNVSDGNLSDTDSIVINITTETRPDIDIINISFYPENPTEEDNITIVAILNNIIDNAIFDIAFYDGDPNDGWTLIENTSAFAYANELSTPYVMWDATNITLGEHNIFVVVSDVYPNESNEGNNIANATVSIIHPANDTHKFYIKNSTGNNVAWLGNFGNIVLKGKCFSGGNCDNPGNNLFILRNSTDNNVAFINSTGDLCIEKGDCSDESVSCNPLRDAFIIQNSSASNMSYIDFDGDLCLIGKLYENTEP